MLRTHLLTDSGADVADTRTNPDAETDIETNGSAPDRCTDCCTDRNAEHDAAHTAAVSDANTDADTDVHFTSNAFGSTWTCSGWIDRRCSDDRFVGLDLAPLLELKLSEPKRCPPS